MTLLAMRNDTFLPESCGGWLAKGAVDCCGGGGYTGPSAPTAVAGRPPPPTG